VSAPSLPSLLLTHWQLEGSVLAPAAVGAALYLGAAGRVRARWPAGRTLCFLVGIAVIVVALDSGLGTWDDRLLSSHMAQHMLLLLIAPLLLLGGRPVVLLLAALPPGARPRPARALAATRGYTGPLPSLGFFTAAVVLTHLPSFYDATLRHPALHYGEHLVYLTAGLLLLSPLLHGDPAPRHRLGGLGTLAYVMASMVPMAVVGAFLNRHAGVFYAPYAPPAQALGVSAVDDQAQAGAIMWVLGNSIMVAIGLWAAVAAMVAEERRQAAREARGVGVTGCDGGLRA
jgi:cytochrome c oxidase assembly factor CtaG